MSDFARIAKALNFGCDGGNEHEAMNGFRSASRMCKRLGIQLGDLICDDEYRLVEISRKVEQERADRARVYSHMLNENAKLMAAIDVQESELARAEQVIAELRERNAQLELMRGIDDCEAVPKRHEDERNSEPHVIARGEPEHAGPENQRQSDQDDTTVVHNIRGADAACQGRPEARTRRWSRAIQDRYAQLAFMKFGLPSIARRLTREFGERFTIASLRDIWFQRWQTT